MYSVQIVIQSYCLYLKIALSPLKDSHQYRHQLIDRRTSPISLLSDFVHYCELVNDNPVNHSEWVIKTVMLMNIKKFKLKSVNF